MKKSLTKGFTLIELLVVIAIIGILASVILASLSTARNKGADAAVKSDFENARPQAEIYYDGHSNSYASVCTTATSSNGINTMMTDAVSKLGLNATSGFSSTAASSPTVVACHDSITAWAASAPLKSISGSYWCVDSTGKAEQTTTVLGSGQTTCTP